MRTVLWRLGALTVFLSLAGVIPLAAQDADPPAAVTLPATGKFANGGHFVGTVTINRFEQRDNQIVAIGFVRGTLFRWGRTLGTALAGEVSWSVAVGVGGVSPASGPAAPPGRVTPIALSISARQGPRIVPVQAAACSVLNLALGANNVDLLGLQVQLDPITVNLQGVTGTPLGDLVCAASDLLGNVAGLVQLLSSILGLLTGLLGGLTGGLGL